MHGFTVRVPNRPIPSERVWASLAARRILDWSNKPDRWPNGSRTARASATRDVERRLHSLAARVQDDGESFVNIFNQNIRLWTDAQAPHELRLCVPKGEADRFVAGQNKISLTGFDVKRSLDRDGRRRLRGSNALGAQECPLYTLSRIDDHGVQRHLRHDHGRGRMASEPRAQSIRGDAPGEWRRRRRPA